MPKKTIYAGFILGLFFLCLVAPTIFDVSFAINTNNLTVNVGDNGSSNITSQTVNWGSVENFIFTPDAGYSVADVMVNGTIDEGAVTSLSLTITGDTTIDVSFAINTNNLNVYPYFAHVYNMTGPTLAVYPTPTPTATPSLTPTPTATPTTIPSQTPALATMSQNLSVIVAVIILGAVVVGIFIQRRKHPNLTMMK